MGSGASHSVAFSRCHRPPHRSRSGFCGRLQLYASHRSLMRRSRNGPHFPFLQSLRSQKGNDCIRKADASGCPDTTVDRHRLGHLDALRRCADAHQVRTDLYQSYGFPPVGLLHLRIHIHPPDGWREPSSPEHISATRYLPSPTLPYSPPLPQGSICSPISDIC